MEVSIPEIMRKVQVAAEVSAEIDEKNLCSDILPFDRFLDINSSLRGCFNFNELNQLVETCNKIYAVSAWRPLSGNPIKVFVKKAIRKCCKFYVEPIANDQTLFNAAVVRTINCIGVYINERNNSSTLSNMENRIAVMEYKIESGNRDFVVDSAKFAEMDSITSENFEVSDIVKRIRFSNQSKGLTAVSEDGMPDNGKFNIDELNYNLSIINRNCVIQCEREIPGKFKFIKKIIRKFLRFYIEPIVQTQNQYNSVLAQTLNLIKNYIESSGSTESKINDLSERLYRLEQL